MRVVYFRRVPLESVAVCLLGRFKFPGMEYSQIFLETIAFKKESVALIDSRQQQGQWQRFVPNVTSELTKDVSLLAEAPPTGLAAKPKHFAIQTYTTRVSPVYLTENTRRVL